MQGVVPYGKGSGSVIVYRTVANDGAMEFGVMLPRDTGATKEKESELNRRALAIAKEFVIATGGDPTWVKLEGCAFCHVDDLSAHPDALWHMPAFRAWILPKDGCPTP